MPFYSEEGFVVYEEYMNDAGEWELAKYLSVDNSDCHRKFIHDLSLGMNFLFHTRRNPRNNFVFGVNTNIGFVPRYSGFFSLKKPFTEDVKDCDITCQDRCSPSIFLSRAICLFGNLSLQDGQLRPAFWLPIYDGEKVSPIIQMAAEKKLLRT